MSMDPAALDVMPLVGMTTLDERLYLRQLGETFCTGRGAVVDLGCWLGSSTISLAQGLARNRRLPGDWRLEALDCFRWADYMERAVAGTRLAGRFPVGASFREEFDQRIAPWQPRVVAREVDLESADWQGGPIELLVVDAMKSWRLASAIARAFYPSLVPGISRMVHQDFAHAETPWVALGMYRLRDFFRPVDHVPESGMVDFECVRAIPAALFERAWSADDFSDAEVAAAFDHAAQITGGAMAAHFAAGRALVIHEQGHQQRALQCLATGEHAHPHKASVFAAIRQRVLAEAAREPDGDEADRAWQVMLAQSVFPLVAGRAYRLNWRMRADRPRSVHATIVRGHDDWAQIGPYVPRLAQPEWQTCVSKFTALAGEADAVLQFRLGHDDGPCEIADVTLADTERGGAVFPLAPDRWQLVHEPDRVAARVTTSAEVGVVRVEFRRPTVEELPLPLDAVRLEHDLEPLAAAQKYELRFRARAELGREIDVTIAQAHEPWTELGLFAKLRLWPEWQEFSLPFVPVADEGDPRIVVQGGADTAPFEIADVALHGPHGVELPDLRGWEIRQDAARPAQLTFVAPEGVRVSYRDEAIEETPDDEAWRVLVQRQTPPVMAGERYALEMSLRADRPREVTIALVQELGPFEPLGLVERVRIWRQWQAFRWEFVARLDEPNARLAVRVGGNSTPVEMRSARLTRAGDGQELPLTIGDDWWVWRAEPTPVRLQRQGDGWRIEFPEVGRALVDV